MGRNTTLELFVRSLHPRGATQRQEAIISRLDRMEEADVIDGYTVSVWGDEIVRDGPSSETEMGRYVRDRLAEFQDWAAAEGVSIDRFYQTLTIDSELTGTTFERTTLPIMALAEYEDDDLVYLTPHEGDEVESVVDRLDVLAGEHDPAELDVSSPSIADD